MPADSASLENLPAVVTLKRTSGCSLFRLHYLLLSRIPASRNTSTRLFFNPSQDKRIVAFVLLACAVYGIVGHADTAQLQAVPAFMHDGIPAGSAYLRFRIKAHVTS